VEFWLKPQAACYRSVAVRQAELILAELILAGPQALLDDAVMRRERRRHSKWRRFVRQNQNLVLAGVLLLMVLAAVAGLVYVMTSGRFLSS